MPAVWYVTNGNDSGSGSLRDAFASAQAGGNQQTIMIDEDVELIELDSPLTTATLQMTALEIIGEDPNDPVEIEPSTGDENEFRFFAPNGPNGTTVTLENLIVANFGAPEIRDPNNPTIILDPGDSGAIRITSPLVIENCQFNTNFAFRDGGAIHTGYAVTMTTGEFTGNEALRDGGAIHHIVTNGTGHALTFTNVEFATNIAGNNGGAIYYLTEVGVLTLTGSTTLFFINAAGNQGGAIWQYGGSLDIENIDGFLDDADGGVNSSGDHASTLFLEELVSVFVDADIDGGGSPGGFTIFLHNNIPPNSPADRKFNISRVVGGASVIDTNWTLNWP